MIRKSLIALVILALFAGSVQAHPAWGVTTSMNWEWAKKTTYVDVHIKIVRWAELAAKWAIVLVQQDDTSFEGCTWVEVCNNFRNLAVEAELVNITENVAQNWYVSLIEVNSMHGDRRDGYNPEADGAIHPDPDYSGGKEARVVVDDTGRLNLTGYHGWLSLCVKAEGVDPQAMEYNPDNPQDNIRKVAEVLLTYYPDLPPSNADADFGAVTDYGPGSADDLTDDDQWPGAGIPNGHPTMNTGKQTIGGPNTSS